MGANDTLWRAFRFVSESQDTLWLLPALNAPFFGQEMAWLEAYPAACGQSGDRSGNGYRERSLQAWNVFCTTS